jgi:hypothetical protein
VTEYTTLRSDADSTWLAEYQCITDVKYEDPNHVITFKDGSQMNTKDLDTHTYEDKTYKIHRNLATIFTNGMYIFAAMDITSPLQLHNTLFSNDVNFKLLEKEQLLKTISEKLQLNIQVFSIKGRLESIIHADVNAANAENRTLKIVYNDMSPDPRHDTFPTLYDKSEFLNLLTNKVSRLNTVQTIRAIADKNKIYKIIKLSK